MNKVNEPQKQKISKILENKNMCNEVVIFNGAIFEDIAIKLLTVQCLHHIKDQQSDWSDAKYFATIYMKIDSILYFSRVTAS